jgi:hypothetical protein
MSIRYVIDEELNIAFIFCEGKMTAQEYFKAMRALANEAGYQHGMLKIVDFYCVREDFHLSDMRESLAYNENLAEQGLALDHTVVLSHSDGVTHLVKTMKLLSQKVSLKFDVFSTLAEAISALGLSAHRQEILDFYRKSKTLKR